MGAVAEPGRLEYAPGGTPICRIELRCEGERFAIVMLRELAEKGAALAENQRVRIEGRLTAYHWSTNAMALQHHRCQLIADRIEVLDGIE